uniref:Cilia- and flagella-associated protein 157 n=1 Tax=Schistosoma mansoni TaxID=6183 RepID=A0A5K4EKC1_SCHMA
MSIVRNLIISELVGNVTKFFKIYEPINQRESYNVLRSYFVYVYACLATFIQPPKKNKSSGSRSQRKSSQKLSSSSRKSNNQLILNNDLLQSIDELDDVTIQSFGRDYYLFLIKQLEMQVNAYENYVKQLSMQNQKIITKYHTSDFECQDHFRTLNKRYHERINEAADLTERIQAMQRVFRTNLDKWRARENELEMLKKSTEERMMAENLAIANELASLEEFRLNREALWIYYHNLESTLDQIKNEHKLAMENLSESDVAYRGRLKKVTKLKINEVASEFRSTSFQRTEPTIKRMLAENVSIEDQLVKLSVAIAEISRENVDLLTEFYHLTDEQSKLEKEQILLSTRSSAILKGLVSKKDNLLNNLKKINKESVDCSDSIHHLTDCISYAAEYIQTVLSTNPNQSLNKTYQSNKDTTDQLKSEDTKEILFKLYNKLNSVDCIIDKYDTIQLDGTDNENEIDNTLSEKSHIDNLSDISEPNYELDIDETMSISEPEDIGQNNRRLITSSKSDDMNKLENMERLDKIWSQINTSYLKSYDPASNEWKEILNILAKNQINWSENLKNKSTDLHDGYLKPGDLKFIPPPSTKILTKKEYMSSLRRRESRSKSRSRKLIDNISDNINERSKSVGVQTRSSSCVSLSKSKQLRFEE